MTQSHNGRDPQQGPDGGPPRREPSRMGGLFMAALIVVMAMLILQAFSHNPAALDGRSFERVWRLAHLGDVTHVRLIEDRSVNAKVLVDGKLEAWDGIPVPTYARERLDRLVELVSRKLDPDVEVTLTQLDERLEAGAWDLREAYLLSDPPADSTGLFVSYRLGSDLRWSEIRWPTDGLEPQRGTDADVNAVVAKIEGAGVPVDVISTGVEGRAVYEPSNDLWSGLLFTMVPWLFVMGLFLFFIMRQMRAAGGGGGIMSFGRSKVKMITPDQAKITFDMVAGVEEAKEEVTEIIHFLKDPKRFSRLGGRVPRGVLLVGPPGTGKTLLAKAIAGEANVPFFAISGSDFVEMFVGVGASRVRDLFKQARENAPCVIFLDEIDAVGRKRGAGLGGGHDEREQTLNAILVEMDGFETDAGVIMIAATNRPDVLDAALMRPGRFDRQIVLDLPDVRGREAILLVHSQKVKMSPDVDLSVVARSTPMFSGAELEALINEAALIATLKDKDQIELDDLEEARDKVRFGRQKRSRVMEEEDRRVTAYHEAGHALVAEKLPGEVEPVHKVTIIPRGMALGATMQLPQKDKYHQRRRELEGMLAMLYGGRVAEEIFCDDISGGASNDIERATEIARAMVCSLGMSEALGPMALGESRSEVFLGDELMRNKNYSEATSEAIDAEVRRILDVAYDRAKTLIAGHRDEMERITQALMRYETISGDDVRAIMAGASVESLRPPPPPAEPVRAPVTPAPPRDEPEQGFGTAPMPEPA